MNRQHWSRRNPERVARGTKASGAKLSELEIEEICRTYRTNRTMQTRLARKFGVCRMTIWRHLKAAGLK